MDRQLIRSAKRSSFESSAFLLNAYLVTEIAYQGLIQASFAFILIKMFKSYNNMILISNQPTLAILSTSLFHPEYSILKLSASFRQISHHWPSTAS